MSELKCDVCGKSANKVRASRCGPISFAYCDNCLKTCAEPYGAVVSYFGLADYKSYDDFKDSPWQSIVDDTLKVTGKTIEQFNIDLEKEANFDWNQIY